jgi:hypothetical protein
MVISGYRDLLDSRQPHYTPKHSITRQLCPEDQKGRYVLRQDTVMQHIEPQCRGVGIDAPLIASVGVSVIPSQPSWGTHQA